MDETEDTVKGRRQTKAGAWLLVGVCMVGLTCSAWMAGTAVAKKPPHTITIENQSGQIAEIKVIGPSREFIKVPLDQKRTVHVTQGTYHLLVRYGFSPKEYVYTKSNPFLVSEKEGKFSRITFTLHRIVTPSPGAQRVSGDEFESATLTGP